MAVAAVPRGRFQSRAARRAMTGYLFLLPALALMTAFTFYPFVQGLALSFQSWDGVGGSSWVGLANYQRVIGDNIFWASLGNAGIFGAVGFILGNILSLGMALAVNSLRRGATFYRVAY
jgi:ABC-type sugar transport system permease subunit